MPRSPPAIVTKGDSIILCRLGFQRGFFLTWEPNISSKSLFVNMDGLITVNKSSGGAATYFVPIGQFSEAGKLT